MRLVTLGPLNLVESSMHRPKPLLLLAYLALQGPTVKRYLAELFFPHSKDRADALATTLARLRQHGVPISDQDRIISTSILCDAIDFKRDMDTKSYNNALILYKGAFAKGLELTLSSELEEWLLAERERFASLAREAHLALGERALTAGDIVTARQRSESAYLLEAAPLLEEAEFKRLYRLLTRTHSTLLTELRKEAEELGVSLPSLSDTPHNLPSLLTRFVGRDLERLELASLLRESDGRLITIHGPGGVGKTRLALQVAADHLNSSLFSDGVYFVTLDGLVSPGQLLATLAQTVGASVSPDVSVLDVASIGQALGSRQLLLVLDNFEHLVEGASLLPKLLEACSNLSLLVTSRERLNLKSEWVLTLDGLDFPNDASDPERVLLCGAVQLFAARARRAQLRFTIAYDDLGNVLRICRAVSGFPLGLELAAAWVKVYPLEALASELEANAAALETPHQDIRERHRSMGAAFNYSWQQLEPASREFLKRLAVFKGGFDLDAAVEVAGATPQALALLSDKALLQVGKSRYTFHALLQQYLRRKLVEDPALEREMRARHGVYYSGLLTRFNTEILGGTSTKLLYFMGLEEGNLLAFLEWALAEKQYARLSALAEPLLWHLPLQGRFQEGIALCKRVLNELLGKEVAVHLSRAAFLSSYSFLEFFAGSSENAVRLAKEALELTEAINSRETDDIHELDLQLLRALDALGQAYTRLGESEAAIRYLRRAERVARQYGDSVRLMRVLRNLGNAYVNDDKLDLGLSVFREGLALYHEGLVPRGMDVVALYAGFGFGQFLSEDYFGAIHTLEIGFALAHELDSKGQQPMLLALRALAELERAIEMDSAKGFTQVAALCRDTLIITKGRGEVQGHIFLLTALARCELELGHRPRALSLLAEAYELAWERQNFPGLFCVLPYVVEVALGDSEFELVGEIIGFLSASKHAESWFRRRTERALRLWQFNLDVDETFQAALERGSSMKILDVSRRIMLFTKKNHHK